MEFTTVTTTFGGLVLDPVLALIPQNMLPLADLYVMADESVHTRGIRAPVAQLHPNVVLIIA